MAQPALVRQPALANEPSGSGCVLPATQARYLSTIRQLLVEYQHARGSMQRQMFVKMVHAFMQDLCGYPPSSYIMTSSTSLFISSKPTISVISRNSRRSDKPSW